MKKPQDTTFKEWHKYSKVKHVVYHATVHLFDEFDAGRSDLGAHFGNIEQANNIAKNRLADHPQGGPFIIPVWLQLNNPIRLKDEGSFHADGIAVQMEKLGLLERGEGKRIRKEIDADWRLRKKYNPALLDILQLAGYDGVVYKNTAEGEGAGDSYIVFKSSQILFAISNPYNQPKLDIQSCATQLKQYKP